MAEHSKGYVNYLLAQARQTRSDDVQPDISAFNAPTSAYGGTQSTLSGETDNQGALSRMVISSWAQQQSSPRRVATGCSGRSPLGEPGAKLDGAEDHMGGGNTGKSSTGRLRAPIEDRDSGDRFRKLRDEYFTVDQLTKAAKSQYKVVVKYETQCSEQITTHLSSTGEQDPDQRKWEGLLDAHERLLREYCDFFFICQHSSAEEKVRNLVVKNSMHERIWRHGISSLLKLLHSRLPSSMSCMRTFIDLSYGIVVVLHEAAPDFPDTWIGCLGQLSVQRMRIESDDLWNDIAKFWYSEAAGRWPTVGRPYYHLAAFTRPSTLLRLFYCVKSLCVPHPELNARDTLMTLVDSILACGSSYLHPADYAFVRVHGILFSGKSADQLKRSMDAFWAAMDEDLEHRGERQREPAYLIGIILIFSLLGYGSSSNPLMLALAETWPKHGPKPLVEPLDELLAERLAGSQEQRHKESHMELPTEAKAEDKDSAKSDPEPAFNAFHEALAFATRTYELIFRHDGAADALSSLHPAMLFILYLSNHPNAMSLVSGKFPWKQTVKLLNSAVKELKSELRTGEVFHPAYKPLHPLPEDYAMLGLPYGKDDLPPDWFVGEILRKLKNNFEQADPVDNVQRGLEFCERRRRIVLLGRGIARTGQWIKWDEKLEEFTVNSKYDVDLDTGSSANVAEGQ